MPLFKTRSAKIEPFNGAANDDKNYSENHNPQPKLDLFQKVSNSSETTHSVENHKRVLLTERMNDPEEICELSPLTLFYNSSSSNNNLKMPDSLSTPDGSLFRRSMDFCQTDFPPPPSFQPTRKGDKENSNDSNSLSSTRDNFPIWRKQDESAFIDRTSSKGTRWLIKDIDNTAKLKLKFRKCSNTRKINDVHSWTTSPDRFYNYIFRTRNFSRELDTNVQNVDERLKRSLLAQGDRRYVSFSPEVLIFSCVMDNLKDDLEFVLCNSKIDVNAYNQNGDFSPLHLSAELGHVDCVEALIFHGANVNLLDRFGHSPLHNALSGLHFECAVLLIEAGADIHQCTVQKLKEMQQLRKKTEFYQGEIQEG